VDKKTLFSSVSPLLSHVLVSLSSLPSLVSKPLTHFFLLFIHRREDREYKVADIAWKPDGEKFIPFGLEGTKDSGSLCVLIPELPPCEVSANKKKKKFLPRSSCSSVCLQGSDCTFLPILRLEHYMVIDNYYTTWEQGLMFTLAGLYFCLCLLTVFELVYIYLHPDMALLLQNVVQGAIFFIALMRGMFFVLVPTISWFQDNDIAEFVSDFSFCLHSLSLCPSVW
jgi:hypothetical protein